MWLLARNGQLINAALGFKIEIWPVEFRKLPEYDAELESDVKAVKWGLKIHISFGVMSTDNEDQGNLTDWYILADGYGAESIEEAERARDRLMRELNNPGEEANRPAAAIPVADAMAKKSQGRP